MVTQISPARNIYQFGAQQGDAVPAEFSPLDLRLVAPARNPFNDPLVMSGVEAMRDLVAFAEGECMGEHPTVLMARYWLARVNREERAYADGGH